MPRRRPFPRLRRSRYLAVVDPNHVLPRTYEWNASVERSFGKTDVITLTYVGAAGRKLMRQDLYSAPNPELHRRVRSNEKWRERELQRAASAVPASLRPRPSDAALLHVVAFHRQRFVRRLLRERAARHSVLGSRFVRPTTSGTPSPARFPMTFPLRAAESGNRSSETGPPIRSSTRAPRRR